MFGKYHKEIAIGCFVAYIIACVIGGLRAL